MPKKGAAEPYLMVLVRAILFVECGSMLFFRTIPEATSDRLGGSGKSTVDRQSLIKVTIVAMRVEVAIAFKFTPSLMWKYVNDRALNAIGHPAQNGYQPQHHFLL